MVKIPIQIAGWMKFRHLDNLAGAEGVYTLAWRLTDVPDDPWTRRLMEFKAPRQRSVRAAAATLGLALPALLESKNWNPHRTGIAAALSSGDTGLNPSKPLPRVASACAAAVGLRNLLTLLTKNAHRPLHMVGSAANRQEEIRKANYRANLANADGLKRILVLDDLATNGGTLSAIAAAIHRLNPNLQIFGIALGKNESQGYAANYGQAISNADVPPEWAERWDQTP